MDAYIISVQDGDMAFAILADLSFIKVIEAPESYSWAKGRIANDMIKFFLNKGFELYIKKIHYHG